MPHIPLDHPTVARIKELVPAEHHAQTWIAGSAATHWEQNGDVDAWVVGLNWAQIVKLRGQLRWEAALTAETVPTEMYAAASTMCYASEGIHLLGTGWTSISDVIEQFDISSPDVMHRP